MPEMNTVTGNQEGNNNNNNNNYNNYANNNGMKRVIPWQASTAGMVLGFFFGFVCCLIALMGNYQYKQGKDISELIKAYNIILIIAIIIIALTIVFSIIFAVAIAANGGYYGYNYY